MLLQFVDVYFTLDEIDNVPDLIGWEKVSLFYFCRQKGHDFHSLLKFDVKPFFVIFCKGEPEQIYFKLSNLEFFHRFAGMGRNNTADLCHQ